MKQNGRGACWAVENAHTYVAIGCFAVRGRGWMQVAVLFKQGAAIRVRRFQRSLSAFDAVGLKRKGSVSKRHVGELDHARALLKLGCGHYAFCTARRPGLGESTGRGPGGGAAMRGDSSPRVRSSCTVFTYTCIHC